MVRSRWSVDCGRNHQRGAKGYGLRTSAYFFTGDLNFPFLIASIMRFA